MHDNLDNKKGELKNVENREKRKTWRPWYSWKGIIKNVWKKGNGKLGDNLDDDIRDQVRHN